MTLEIVQLPVLSDNYCYLLYDKNTEWCGVIDPSVANIPLDEAHKRGWKIQTILNTHHHFDHVGGNLEIEAETGATVFGPYKDKNQIPMISQTVKQGDKLQFGHITLDVIETPGHTLGHVVYYESKNNALFSGDSLFVLGCGRLFEGTPAQMWHSIMKMRALPNVTRLFCAHEYSENNAKFALTIDPKNFDLINTAERIFHARKEGRPTVPTLLGQEILTNPFLRADNDDLKQALGFRRDTPPVEVFAEIRMQKDSF